jgi:hypothetical protein
MVKFNLKPLVIEDVDLKSLADSVVLTDQTPTGGNKYTKMKVSTSVAQLNVYRNT